MMSCLTDGIPPGPPRRQQAVRFDYARSAPHVSKGGSVGRLVASGSVPGQ